MSTDSVEANRSFAAKYDFPFPLLSDPKREVCIAYGACDGPDATKAKRFTYVIGPDGKILEVFEDVRPHEHAEMLLNLLGKSTHPAPQELGLSMDQGVQTGQHGASATPTTNEGRKVVQNEQNPATESQLESTGGVVADAVAEPPTKLDVQLSEDRTSEVEAIIPDLEADSPSSVMAAVEVMPDAATDPASILDVQLSEDRTFEVEAIIPDLEADSPSPVMAGVESSAAPEHAAVIGPSQVQPAQETTNRVSLVYALGTIGYDFGSEARRDGIAQAMPNSSSAHNAGDLLAHLAEYPYEAASVIWTLSLDDTPIYAIEPSGAFAAVAYERLREFLSGQVNEGVQRVSIPGIVAGQIRLISGQFVPAIVPALRGMYSWSTAALVEAVLGQAPTNETERAAFEQKQAGISNFLERIYYELRNLGTRSQERAMNFAATNAFQITQVFADAAKEGLELDQIEVEASPICRPGSDCWDVKLVFFEPSRRLERARKVYRFTVDVSDMVPVTVGAVRSWSVY